jgi:hypothetical protein
LRAGDAFLTATPIKTWPADVVERRSIAALAPYARNPRTHSDEQVAQIAASIREWGWTVPVLVDEAGTIIAGHGRVLAASRSGIVDVPIMVARGWSEAQKRAYTIADNKLTDNGGWDDALLKIEVADLESLGFDLPLMGFSEAELAQLTNSNPGLTDPDEAPEPKHIPSRYQRAAATQRMALLQGLMDTNGYVSAAGQCEFVSTLERFARDVLELVRGLGFKATISVDRAWLHGIDYGPRYRILGTRRRSAPTSKIRRSRTSSWISCN